MCTAVNRRHFSTLLRDRPSVTCGSILQPGAHLPPHRLTVKRHCCVLHQGCARPGILLRAGQRKNLAGWARVNVCMVGRKSEKYNHKLNTGPDDFLLFFLLSDEIGVSTHYLGIHNQPCSVTPPRFCQFLWVGASINPCCASPCNTEAVRREKQSNASEGQLRKS